MTLYQSSFAGEVLIFLSSIEICAIFERSSPTTASSKSTEQNINHERERDFSSLFMTRMILFFRIVSFSECQVTN